MIVHVLTHLFLILQQSSAQKVIGNGLGIAIAGAEEKIVDYAELAVDEQANLPSQVCYNLHLPAFI